MTTFLSFFSLISGVISEANVGLNQALDASKDQPSQFVIPQIEMDIKCFVIKDSELKIVSSDAQTLNYFGKKGESTIKLTFKLKPKQN
ncbi:MAG: hypothetical protein NWF01_11500 [Candidatus Bathyarchaeota archaeon]|nr:hypothetical protein [Candidatus Bathyarchaeota archaeon]